MPEFLQLWGFVVFTVCSVKELTKNRDHDF